MHVCDVTTLPSRRECKLIRFERGGREGGREGGRGGEKARVSNDVVL